jgi:NAD(P)-dependent dehydrogenase (short-subunit alcohol dehydrogenase family)
MTRTSSAPHDTSMDGKTCVVTGATRGIGLAAASALAARGARVVLVGRDAGRLQAARAAVASRTEDNRAPDTVLADLATAAGVETVVTALAARGEPVDVLLNNAGAIYPVREQTADGIERTFALNHLAPYRLTIGIAPLLRAAKAARVITVASEAHRFAGTDLEDWQSERAYSPMVVYGRSKLANILFTAELARRLEGSGIATSCFHPGVVKTEFAGGTRGLLAMVFALARPFMRSPERGAATGVYLASSPDVAGTSGLYYVDERPRTPSPAALDHRLAESLWETSEALTGISLPR